MKKKKKRCKKVIHCFCEHDWLPVKIFSCGLLAVYGSTYSNTEYDVPAKITVEWTEP